METTMNNVIATLNTIPVVGTENMRRMVGCVDALVMLTNALQASTEPSKVGEGVDGR